MRTTGRDPLNVEDALARKRKLDTLTTRVVRARARNDGAASLLLTTFQVVDPTVGQPVKVEPEEPDTSSAHTSEDFWLRMTHGSS